MQRKYKPSKEQEESESQSNEDHQQSKDLELFNQGMQDIPYELLLQANKVQNKTQNKQMGIKSKNIFVEEKRTVREIELIFKLLFDLSCTFRHYN